MANIAIPSAHNQNGGALSPNDLCGDQIGRLVAPNLQLTVHLAPDTGVTPEQLAAVVTARARDVVALSDGGAEYAGHHTTDVQEWHAETPAMVIGCLTLHAGKAKKAAATGAHITAAVADTGAPCPRVVLGGGHHRHHLAWLLLDGHGFYLVP